MYIGQRKGGKQPGGVLGQAAGAHFAEAPEPLDHVEGVLTSRPGSRAAAINEPLIISQRLARAAAAVDAIANARVLSALAMKLAPIGSKDFLLLTMQQRGQLGDVSYIGRCGVQAVHDAVPVGAHMRLHPKVLVLALAGLVHLPVPHTLGLLGRGWGGDDGGIHNGAGLQQQPLLIEQPPDVPEDPLAEPVLLEQMPEAQGRRLIRHRILGQLDAGKASYSASSIDGSERLNQCCMK
jgi:hypothetical protein